MTIVSWKPLTSTNKEISDQSRLLFQYTFCRSAALMGQQTNDRQTTSDTTELYITYQPMALKVVATGTPLPPEAIVILKHRDQVKHIWSQLSVPQTTGIILIKFTQQVGTVKKGAAFAIWRLSSNIRA